MIGFVGRPATQEGMRPPLVEPFHVSGEVGAEIPASEGHVKQSCAFALQSANEALDDSNAPVLPHGTEAGFDLCPFAPALETVAPELATLVGDDVLGLGAVVLDRAIQELLNSPGSGRPSEDHETYPPA